jgi:hypothetical protein
VKVIRILFDDIIDDIIIPNTIPISIRESYITARLSNTLDDFKNAYLEKYNKHFPHDSYLRFFHLNNCDTISDANDSHDLPYFGSPDVEYMYFIGTGGNISHGLNVDEIPNYQSYFDSLSADVLHYLKTKSNFYIMIRQNQEGIFFKDFEKIYKDCVKYNIPLDKIIISSDIFNFNDIVNEIENKYNCNFNIKYFTFPWALYQAAHLIEDLQENNNIINDISNNKEFKLLCLNRKLKENRVFLLSYLLSKNYEKSSLISFDSKFIENMDNMMDVMKSYNNPDIVSGYLKLIDINRTILDVDDLNDNVSLITDDKSLYEHSFISVVTETETHSDKVRFTEKLLKPILNYHPFIVYGPSHILEILKYYGFKTFNNYLDESYDLIDDTNDRAISIFNVIDNIMMWDNDTMNKFTENVKDILIHNRLILEKFTYNNLVDEYHTNLLLLIDGKLDTKYNSIISTKFI